MSDSRSAHRTATPPDAAAAGGDDVQQQLRSLGSRAHQLKAAARAADHFNARDTADDRHTGSWLMSTALALASELGTEIDALARTLKDHPPVDAALQATVSSVRVRAHQLRAAARAADHFLDQPGADDRETGNWLVATAVTLAHRLAAEIDDSTATAAPRRGFVEADVIDPQDPAQRRRVGASPTTAATLRGAS